MKTLVAFMVAAAISVAHAEGEDHQFLAVATGSVPSRDNVFGQMVAGFGKGATKTEASDAAMAKCRSHADEHPQAAAACQIVLEQDNGCLYYTLGGDPWGDMGAGFGQSPQEAYDQCHSFNPTPLDCRPRVSGACAEAPFERAWSAIKEAPKVKAWLGLAAGFATVGDGSGRMLLSVGKGWGPTKDSAEAAAQIDCSASNEKYTKAPCRGEIQSFETGCHYIAYSFAADQKTPVLKVRETKEEALEACMEAGGTTCDTSKDAVGGCAQ